MRLILLTVTVAAVVGVIAGGTFRDFPSIKLRLWGLALAGAVLQFIPAGGDAAMVLLLASFAALLTFTISNVRAPVASNQMATLDDLIHNGGAQHHLADAGTSLPFLGDVIPRGGTIDQVISVGDVCVKLGTAWFIVFAMPRRHPKVFELEAAI